MCGIAGVLTVSFQASTEQYIQTMQTALEHRGPDDRGIYRSEDRHIALAHTRLSILDLSQNGHQPMSINSRYWITFNGEIYNFIELRNKLKSEGETFFSHTDTEVILKLYAKYGEECLKLLRGMFAFAIWDDLEKVCFIARDPLGIKPLYYWQQGSTLMFASELRTIIATGAIPKKISPIGLYTYLTNGSVSEPWTMIEGVKCLEAGTSLIWQSGEIQQKKYWQISFDSPLSNQSISVSEAIAKTRSALLDSVKHHFISDVPVGVFLSGGIDSTAIVAIARQIQSNDQADKLRTYSIVFNEEQWNEGSLAQQVAKDFDTKHTEYLITADIGKKLLPDFLRSLDQPTIDGFNTFCVSQIASQDNMKVVLSGLGSDEMFGGYSTFQQVPNIVKQREKIAFLNAIAGLVGNGLERFSNSPKYRRLGAFLTKENSLNNAYGLARGVFSVREAYQLVQLYLGQEARDQLPTEVVNFSKAASYDSIHFPTTTDEVSYLELSRYMRNQLLSDSDVMSMRWGLELRVPFVDSQLFSEISAIPAAIRLRKGKQLLKEAIPEIPSYIANRPKRGFTFPFEIWMEQEWRDYTMHIKTPPDLPLPRKQWYRRWSLAVLEHWQQNVLG